MARRIWTRGAIVASASVAIVGMALAQPARNGSRPPGGAGGPQFRNMQGAGQGQGNGAGTNRPRNNSGSTTRPGSGSTTRPSPDQLFDRIDTNHDGVLSRDEFKAFLSHLPPPPPLPQQGSGSGNDR